MKRGRMGKRSPLPITSISSVMKMNPSPALRFIGPAPAPGLRPASILSPRAGDKQERPRLSRPVMAHRQVPERAQAEQQQQERRRGEHYLQPDRTDAEQGYGLVNQTEEGRRLRTGAVAAQRLAARLAGAGGLPSRMPRAPPGEVRHRLGL